MTMIKTTIVEYVWIDGDYNLRSKSRVFNKEINELTDITKWNFDGSSTNQSSCNDSEVTIKPCALFNDPFRKDHHKMVLCDTYNKEDINLTTNNRLWAKTIFDKKLDEEPWFGLEQEYFLTDIITGLPLGYPTTNDILSLGQQQYYCSIGCANTFGRNIVDEHLVHCIYAGINISGINAEVAPGQWEFQIGPCLGIEQGDHLWMARYILHRLSEKYKVGINIEPKPLKGIWNGSGCHANYSTKAMREGTTNKSGMDFINEAVNKLEKVHEKHMNLYGKNNKERLCGKNETAMYNTFTHGIGSRDTSIRIGYETYENGKGYFEDRRPSSNCDPYLVTGLLFETTVL